MRDEAVELAGLFGAHAVWCVSDGATLVPILAFVKPDGTREMHRLVAEELQAAVSEGNDWLSRNPEGASSAVLIYDGFVTLESGKTDALILEVRAYAPTSSLRIVVPYRHAESTEGFAVFRPKFLSYEGPGADLQALGQPFFAGVDQHEKGAAVWNAHLDQSR